jgi:hypothetical protein
MEILPTVEVCYIKISYKDMSNIDRDIAYMAVVGQYMA